MKNIQLNMYGFHKQKHAITQNFFQHEKYRRGENICEIRRKPEKKKKSEHKNQQSQNQMKFQNRNIYENSGELIQLKDEQKIDLDYENKQQSQQNQIIQDRKSNSKNQEEISGNSDQNLIQMCEQAIMQNQVLRKTDALLKQKCIELKKMRLKKLKKQAKLESMQDQQKQQMDSEQQELVQNLNNAWQLIKAQTMKINLQLQFYIS